MGLNMFLHVSIKPLKGFNMGVACLLGARYYFRNGAMHLFIAVCL